MEECKPSTWPHVSYILQVQKPTLRAFSAALTCPCNWVKLFCCPKKMAPPVGKNEGQLGDRQKPCQLKLELAPAWSPVDKGLPTWSRAKRLKFDLFTVVGFIKVYSLVKKIENFGAAPRGTLWILSFQKIKIFNC